MKRNDANMRRALRRALEDRFRLDEPMGRHTTIGVGGLARYFALPRSSREVSWLIRFAVRHSLPSLVIGRGSNLIVRDGGYNGLIIKLGGNFSSIRVNMNTVSAEAGASLSRLARKLVKLGRSGLEFAVGIPGSVGGGVWMNAGAYGGEIAQVLSRVACVDRFGTIFTVRAESGTFEYRHSHLPKGSIILTASFRCPPKAIDRTLLNLSKRRNVTQPLEHRSFGCAFINPPGNHAGKLIEQCGLKGMRVGGAEISEKHANFILNIGPDTRTGDIESLISLAQTEVKTRHGITLKTEVVIVGNK
jgi:UDP-N-acetylmuramate dehydrogenase